MNTLDNIIAKFSHIETPESVLGMKSDYDFFAETLAEKQDELEVSEDEEEKERLQSDIEAIEKAQEKLVAKAEQIFLKAEETLKSKAEAEEKAEKEKQSQPPTPPTTEKKKGGIGWMLFGAVALVVTLGAVNVMNKK